MAELRIIDKLDGFYGTWEIFQEEGFARIMARHHGLEIVKAQGWIVLVARSRYLGRIRGILNSPEVHGSAEQWRPQLKAWDLASIKVHTGEWIPSWAKYRSSREDNYVMIFDLSQGKNGLYPAFDKKCRESIRIGQRKEVIVRASEDGEELRKVFAITREISEDGKKFDVPALGLLEDLQKTPYGQLIVALHQGEVIGGYFLLLTKNVYVFTGGIAKSSTSLTPGNLLIYETMSWAAANGYRYLHFGDQSLSATPALTKFKLSFNPMLVPAYSYDVPMLRWKSALSRFIGLVKS